MSNEIIRSHPLRRAMAAAPTTPPAGPESTVRTGSRAAELRAVIPPLDCMTKMRVLAPRLKSAPGLRAGFQVFQIALHHRLQIRIHHDRAGAFVLAKLRQDLMGNGKRHSQVAATPLATRIFILRIGKRKQQRNRNRVRLFLELL